MAIQLDEVNTTVTKEIEPGVVDGYFKAGPFIAMAKSRFTRKWIGPQIQENFMYKPMKGGAYRKGTSFDITRRQTRTGLLFGPRYYQVGDHRVPRRPRSRAGRAARGLLGHPHRHGAGVAHHVARSSKSPPSITARRSPATTARWRSTAWKRRSTTAPRRRWTGNVFPSYGGQTRADVAPRSIPPAGLIVAGPRRRADLLSRAPPQLLQLHHRQRSADHRHHHQPVHGLHRRELPAAPDHRHDPAGDQLAGHEVRQGDDHDVAGTARAPTASTTRTSATTTPPTRPSGG